MFNYRWQGLDWVQRKTVNSSLAVHAWQDASSRPPLSPLLWLWLPPDVTPLLVAAQPPIADLVVSVYFSQLFSSAVNSEEFHALLNHCSYFKSNGIECKARWGWKILPLTEGKACISWETKKWIVLTPSQSVSPSSLMLNLCNHSNILKSSKLLLMLISNKIPCLVWNW